MHTRSVDHWQHEHTFGQDVPQSGERRTRIVIALAAAMMLVEIVAGLAYGSMALLADGLHMASHTAALGLSALAYFYARRYADDRRFTFGTGKINALAAYTSAVFLALFAAAMAFESIGRLVDPLPIAFDQALLVAAAGLVVNAVSAWILRGGRPHHHPHSPHHHGHDLNLRGAYLHVLADALTSLLATLALALGKLGGLVWMDPLMGIVGAVVVVAWSWRLMREAGGILLDRQAPAAVEGAVRSAIEGADDNRVADLHIWKVGPGTYAAEMAVVTATPRPPDHYKALIPAASGVVHATVEVHHCTDPAH
jgi:cation diffusion facilitator family transporter